MEMSGDDPRMGDPRDVRSDWSWLPTCMRCNVVVRW
jgi:hypothetical protein